MKMTLLCRSESFTFKSYGFAFRSDCFYSFTFHLTASTVCFVGACVRNVLDSVVQALLEDKNQNFIYVEQCMHDEAARHYINMIDQTTYGHKFIKEQFNVTPRIGWKIDPFSHSAVQACLLGAEVGFDSLFFGRIDYQDKAKQKEDKNLEVIWRASKRLGSSSQIFASAFPQEYAPPPGDFNFEVNNDSSIVQVDFKRRFKVYECLFRQNGSGTSYMGSTGRATISSGTSTGVYKAYDLRDEGSDYLGKVVSKVRTNSLASGRLVLEKGWYINPSRFGIYLLDQCLSR
ncbi:putative alpha-mannosidase [Helianthus debilis subsp. tardiflorus]